MIDRQKIVTLAIKGPYTSKPRPWLVIQGDDFLETASVTVCMITSATIPDVPMLRINVQPSEMNGLELLSQVQIDKIVTVPRASIDQIVGRLEDEAMRQVEGAISFFLELRRT